MPRPQVQSRPLAWLRVVVLALVGISAAGCADSARFDSSSYDVGRPAPPQNVAAAAPAPQSYGRVEAQPLPAPSQPATVPASPNYSYNAQGAGAYRQNASYSDITGSAAAPKASPVPHGHWTWDGGSPVTVGYGETVDSIARKHRVPVAALMQTNGIREAGQIRPGQRLVIPRYVSGGSQTAAAPAAAPVRAATGGNVHVVQHGETLMSISRRNGVTLTALAHANKLQTNSKLAIGDRITIPGGGHQVAAAQPAPARPAPAPAPQVAQPHTVPATKLASAAPVQTARVAKEEPRTTETVVKTAEPSGAMPSFRWPVKGRVIAGFGSKPNGTQNDGINLAVPEGTPIKAADDGVVAYAGNELKGYGNLVLIRHSNGFVSAYAHASELMVKRGDTIKRGQVIAHAGQTGNVTSPQLHFEIRKGSTPVDPAQYLGGA
ncbi:MAG TPA: LysM peptidoglycan-binding domain-containing M23 family metallopeptidase [Pseudolabrys sp.]|jgi:murein DD-endopeptidase MepM/ murein hydrolase activator NlpD|nr:LysM peptidoglycan-binding domain-containing M23 family metallopeptidase [Pseudolabrys sp.]